MTENELFGNSEQLEKDHFADPGNMVGDLISRKAALDALGERPVVWSDNDDYTLGARNQYDMDRLAIETVPPAQPEITYQTCSDALLKMWMDNVLTDGEYNRIMDKLNAWKGVQT